MGRKLKGAALRAYRRGKAHAREMVDEKASEIEQAPVAEKSNEELFVIDTTGDSKAVCPQQMKQNLTKKQAAKVAKQAKSSLPLLDQKKVEKLVAKHDAKKLQTMLKESKDKLRGDRHAVARNERISRKKPSKFDLWGDHDDSKPKSAKQEVKEKNAKKDAILKVGGIKGTHVERVSLPATKKNSNAVAVDVAHGGQSYRPDPIQYNAVVKAAVSVEMGRQKAQDYRKAPLAAGMSEETRALLLGDSSSESESESDHDEEQEDTNVLHKRRDKLTRARRNKQKRLRVQKAIEDKERKNKKMLNSVAELPRFKKEIKKASKEMAEKKEKLKEKKKQTEGTPGKHVLQKYADKDPINVPTLPVALESEHKDSSLRTIKPKGSLITDRMASFADRNLVSKRKMGDKKRIMQGKRRRLNIKTTRGDDAVKSMAGVILG